jgi:TonB family protein
MFHRYPIIIVAALLGSLLRAQSFMPPEPYGGAQAVKWLCDQEIRFPEAALQAAVDGEVEIGLIVRSNGEVRDLHINRSVRPDVDAEALRVAKLIRWHPASVGGSALDKEHQLEIPFSVKKYMKAHARGTGTETKAFESVPADTTLVLYTDRQCDSLAVPLIARGIRGLPTYLGANLRYPEDARRRDIQGKVGLEFVVETSGTVSNLRATEALGGGCDDEAMRLIRSMAWRPAFKGGKRVRSIMKMDIQFRLDANQRP